MTIMHLCSVPHTCTCTWYYACLYPFSLVCKRGQHSNDQALVQHFCTFFSVNINKYTGFTMFRKKLLLIISGNPQADNRERLWDFYVPECSLCCNGYSTCILSGNVKQNLLKEHVKKQFSRNQNFHSYSCTAMKYSWWHYPEHSQNERLSGVRQSIKVFIRF